MLEWTENYPLLYGILAQRDSRRVFYFMLLNLTFMVIQSTYGFLTGSLGLISDSVHMFFDCVALFMGVCAAVMTKWPASVKFPYGYGKIDTLAGLANGVFLMLISVEIVYEAVERLCEGAELSRTTELLVVSSMGLGINIVGMMSFDHAHHHGHSHSGHDHGHADLDHSHDHSSRSRSSSPSKAERPKKKKEAHSHGSENMHGIYLHIMADALGSVAVVVSTILVRLTGWTGWDPLASCVIAVMIFISAIPLVMSTAGKLLLSLDPDIEYNLRDILGGLSELRGVIGYTVPKFWLNDIQKETGHSHHHHGQTHAHNHDHSHDHHDHSHNHQPVANHDHDHQHHEHSSDVNPPDHRHVDQAPILGVIHLIASRNADLGDVRQRTSQYLKSKHLDLVVQIEREGEGRCWCGGGLKTN
jgi:solute carrier family 30 (zinc transporter), member 5/7